MRKRMGPWAVALLVAALVCLCLLRPRGNALTEDSSYLQEVIELPTLWYDGAFAGVILEGGGNVSLGDLGRHDPMVLRVFLGACTVAWWFGVAGIGARSFVRRQIGGSLTMSHE